MGERRIRRERRGRFSLMDSGQYSDFFVRFVVVYRTFLSRSQPLRVFFSRRQFPRLRGGYRSGCGGDSSVDGGAAWSVCLARAYSVGCVPSAPEVTVQARGRGSRWLTSFPLLTRCSGERDVNGAKRRSGVKAIIVYPMNALANSQVGEWRSSLSFGYPDGKGPVKFARYTGLESPDQRRRILADLPDILPTNYVMLELVLTRPDERQHLVRAAQGLRFLAWTRCTPSDLATVHHSELSYPLNWFTRSLLETANERGGLVVTSSPPDYWCWACRHSVTSVLAKAGRVSRCSGCLG